MYRRLTGKQPHRGRDGVWIYPPLEDSMTEAELQEVDTYASCLQNMVAHIIANRPILDLCLAEECGPCPRISKRWWEQDRVDMEGMQKADR